LNGDAPARRCAGAEPGSMPVKRQEREGCNGRASSASLAKMRAVLHSTHLADHRRGPEPLHQSTTRGSPQGTGTAPPEHNSRITAGDRNRSTRAQLAESFSGPIRMGEIRRARGTTNPERSNFHKRPSLSQARSAGAAMRLLALGHCGSVDNGYLTSMLTRQRVRTLGERCCLRRIY
jgi:hypothetical protein